MTSATESATALALKLIAAEEGLLLRLLSELSFLPDTRAADFSSNQLGFRAPALKKDEILRRASKIESVVPSNILETAAELGAIPRDRMLLPLVETLRHVAMFATSDGGAVEENIKAVQHLVSTGNVKMFSNL